MTTAYEFKLTAAEMEQVIQDNLALQTENIELRTRLDYVAIDAENAKALYEKVNAELRYSEDQMKTATLQLNRYSDRIKMLENETRYLKQRTDNNLNQTVLQMHYKLQEANYEEAMPLLQQKLELLQGYLTDAKQFNSKADSLIYDVRKYLAGYVSETEKYRSMNFVYELKISENGKLIAKLQEENDKLQKQLIEIYNQSMSGSYSDFSVKFNYLKYEPIDKLITKIDQRDRQISDLYCQLDYTREYLTKARERVAALESENYAFKQQERISDCARYNEIGYLKQYSELRIHQLQYELNHAKEETEKRETQVKKLTIEKEYLTAENEQIRGEMARKIIKYYQNQLADIDGIVEENKTQKAVIQYLQTDLGISQRECYEKTDKIEKLRKKVAFYKVYISDAQSMVLSLKTAVFGAGYQQHSMYLQGQDRINALMKQIRGLESGNDASTESLLTAEPVLKSKE